ncbi:MAG: PaaI family thioesterase [Myxococcota bacterium]
MDAPAMAAVLARIPYTRDLGFTIDAATGDGAVEMTLPDQGATRNLFGTVHAGALFTFGETVAGVAAGLKTLDHAFPLARTVQIRYARPATGVVRGLARVPVAQSARVLEEIARDGRSELTVSVVIQDAQKRTVAEMDVAYAFRPIGRKDP